MDKHIFIREWCDAFEIAAQHIHVIEHFKQALFAFLLILLHGSLEVESLKSKWTFCHLKRRRSEKREKKTVIDRNKNNLCESPLRLNVLVSLMNPLL